MVAHGIAAIFERTGLLPLLLLTPIYGFSIL